MRHHITQHLASGPKITSRQVLSVPRNQKPLQQRVRHGPNDAGAITKEQENVHHYDIRACKFRTNLSASRTIDDRSSQLRYVEVLAEELAKLNKQLALDIDAINPAHISARNMTSTPDLVLDSISSETLQKKTFLRTMTTATGTGNSDVLSPEDRSRILSKLSPTLQSRIANGLLFDQVAFAQWISSKPYWPELQGPLTSLIEDELKRAKTKKESQQSYQTRRQSLLNNVEWLRSQGSTQSSLTRSKGRQSGTRERLYSLVRWRDFYISSLKHCQLAPTNTLGANRRVRQFQVLIEETTRSIQQLQEAIGVGNFEPGDKISLSEPDNHHSKQSSHEVGFSIRLRPASLPDNLVYQLSRELLDSLNEAAFDFGQQRAPAVMQKNFWNFPETIDFSVFMSSLSLHPKLFRRFVISDSKLLRLRKFRNQYAHGSGGMTIGNLVSVLKDVSTVARALRSPGLSTKVRQYEALLQDFSIKQTEHTKQAYSLIQDFKSESKEMLEFRQAEAKGDESAAQDASVHLMAYRARTLKKAWRITEQGISEHNARNISLFVGKLQIRRIIERMGPNATTVLSNLQKENESRPSSKESDEDSNEILGSLMQNLSQALAKTTVEPAKESDRRVMNSGSGVDGTTADR